MMASACSLKSLILETYGSDEISSSEIEIQKE
jgi:hypothetical protein